MDIINTLIDLMAFGIPVLVALLVGDLIFREVRGGVKIPLFGSKYVKKSIAFIAFFVSALVAGWAFQYSQTELKNLMTQAPILIVVALLIIYFVFNYRFYGKWF